MSAVLPGGFLAVGGKPELIFPLCIRRPIFCLVFQITQKRIGGCEVNNVRRSRLARGLSKQQVCARAGVSPSTYAKAERGEHVTELSAFKIARALGLDAELQLTDSSTGMEKKVQ